MFICKCGSKRISVQAQTWAPLLQGHAGDTPANEDVRAMLDVEELIDWSIDNTMYCRDCGLYAAGRHFSTEHPEYQFASS